MVCGQLSQCLYESAVAFSMRQSLQAAVDIDRLEAHVADLERRCQAATNEVTDRRIAYLFVC
jgi:Axonemal dynein light chain